MAADGRGKSSSNTATALIAVSGSPGSSSAASGGGFLDEPGKTHFRFNVSSNRTGQVSYEDADSAISFDTTSVDSYSLSGPCATFSGTASLKDGRRSIRYTFKACDTVSRGGGATRWTSRSRAPPPASGRERSRAGTFQ